MTKIYKSAIIGCGNIAGNYDINVNSKYSFTHAGTYKKLKRVKLTAICDNNKSNLNLFKKKWKVHNTYLDFKKMLQKEEIEILSICTPTNTHFDILNFAISIKSLKAIFLEKPSTFNSKETLKIINKLKNKNIVVAVNYFRRWNKSFEKFKNEIIKKKINKLKKIQIFYTKGLYVSCSHQIDLMRFFFGEPKAIKVINKYNKKNNDMGVDFELSFKNVDVNFVHLPNVKYVYFDITIFFDDIIYKISQRGQKIIKYNAVKDKDFNVFNKITKSSESNTEWKNCIINAVKEILHSIDNGIVFSSSNLYNAYNNTKICEQIYNRSK